MSRKTTVFGGQFLLLDMLKENPKSVDDAAEKWTLQNSAVAWKTGTSVGFRDAWSVGILVTTHWRFGWETSMVKAIRYLWVDRRRESYFPVD